MSEQTIGIDFGTSTTLIAEGAAGRRPETVPMGDSTAWMPSVAALRGSDVVVGEDALRQSPSQQIRSVKRCITTNASTVRTADGSTEVRADDVIRSVLSELAARAKMENLPVGTPGVARMGCPAMWTADQRQRLLGLASEAGFGVHASTLVDEPVAAGLMWVNEQVRQGRVLEQDRVLIFDMGGGTLDVAVLDVTARARGARPEIFVLASEGLNEAGDTLDAAIADDIERILATRGIVFSELPDEDLARAYLLRAATEAKIALSHAESVDVDIAYQGVDLPHVTYTREQLEEAFRPQMEDAWQLVLSTLRGSELARKGSTTTSSVRALDQQTLAGRVRHVVLAGGMSQIPAVAGYLGPRLPRAAIHTNFGVPAAEAIVAGLAETTAYERINMNRPAFDFVLEWERPDAGLERVTLYRAHTPFYYWWEAASSNVVKYRWPDGATAIQAERRSEIPRQGSGLIRVINVDGSPVALRRGGEEVAHHGLEVKFGNHDFRFALSTDGSIYIVDGHGREQSLRTQGWPIIRRGLGTSALGFGADTKWFPDTSRRSWDTK